MNPALPVFVLLTAGGGWLLGRRDRRLGAAWAGIGLAGCLLLGPALRLADGIPSPAASLAAHAPWQDSGDPTDGNPVLRDVSFQIQPWLLFVRHELRAGRLPLWNPHQFAGAPFWANGQSAPLFPLHLLFAALPVQLGFVLLPWLRFLIAGVGVWLLGRRLGLEPPGALAAALVFPLSGMLVSFVLFPMGNALALVPWVLWAVDRLAAGESGALPLALTAGLQTLGGHPETVIHTGLLAAVYLLVRGTDPARAKSGGPGFGVWGVRLRFAGGWLAAGALAAVHWLPLVFNLVESSKWREAATGGSLSWAEAGTLLLRLVLPQLYGHPAHGTWWGPFNYSATAVYLGALALPLIAAGLGGLDRRWRAVAAVAGISLLVAYHLPVLSELIRRLPLLGRVAHHRLIFGIELGGALLLGRGLDRWRRGEGSRGALAGAALVAAMLAAAWLVLGEAWQRHGLTAGQTRWTLWAAGLTGLLLLGLRLAPQTRRRIVWLLPALLAADLLAAHGAINPGLSRERLYPETGGVERLQTVTSEAVAGARVAGVGETLRPNAAMVYGLYDVRGDDPVKAARFETLYRRLAAGSAVYFQPISRWDEPLLDELSVRWVVGPPDAEPPAEGWRRIYDGPDARLWERPGALPLVRWRGDAGVEPRVTERTPGRWGIELKAGTSPSGGELVVGEVWDPGWEVRIDGRQGEVAAGGSGLLRIAVPAGTERIELRYRAPGLALGACASLTALLVVLAGALAAAARRRSAIIPPG